jgi:predicted P-loop ATPase
MSAAPKDVKSIPPAPAIAQDWRAALEPKGNGFIGDVRNVLRALRLAPELTNLVCANEFAMRVEFTRAPPWRAANAGAAWLDEDDTALQAWLQDQSIYANQRNVVSDCVALAAKDKATHPVREYLKGVRWDRERRLQVWLAEYLNARGAPTYLNAAGRKFLISAVARIMQPGCQADHVLVLEGAQGSGKSRTARALARRPEWFTAALQCCGRWIVELAELAALRRSEIEGMKAFISRPVDVFRPPYGRRALTVPRQNVFIGTTNEEHYLRDTTGNRRFWPIRCGRIDIDGLERDRDQLWAEAVCEFTAGAIWHMSDEESALARDEQLDRVLVTELEADVSEYLSRMLATGARELALRQVLIEALGLDQGKPDFTERAGRLGPQVASAMQSAGWTKIRTVGRGANRRTLYGCPQ